MTTAGILYFAVALANIAGLLACLSERDWKGSLLTGTGAFIALAGWFLLTFAQAFESSLPGAAATAKAGGEVWETR